MKTLLVPLDFSAVSEFIVTTAIIFAEAFGGKVVLFHAIPPVPVATSEYGMPIEVIQPSYEASEKNARTQLAAYQERLRAAGVGSEIQISLGAPVEAILDEAGRIRADLIIIGSHGHGRLYDLLVGSTANGVLKRAKCGVLIMPAADKES